MGGHSDGNNSVNKKLIAETAHKAVCAVTKNDWFGHCDLYAIAGVMLLGALYQLQAGSFIINADPEHDLAFMIDCSEGGLNRLEYHVWKGDYRPEHSPPAEDGGRAGALRWATCTTLPEGYRYRPELKAIAGYYERVIPKKPFLARFYKEVEQWYGTLRRKYRP